MLEYLIGLNLKNKVEVKYLLKYGIKLIVIIDNKQNNPSSPKK